MAEETTPKKFVINRSVDSPRENESRANSVVINPEHVGYITKKHIQDAEKRKNDIKIMKEYENKVFWENVEYVFIVIFFVLLLIISILPFFILIYMSLQ
jgi:hypothetical protein